jgi:hypothetical protein
MVVTGIIVVRLVVTSFRVIIVWLTWWLGFVFGCIGRRTFDDLIEFATVKPYTTAIGAIIYLNSLAVGHY